MRPLRPLLAALLTACLIEPADAAASARAGGRGSRGQGGASPGRLAALPAPLSPAGSLRLAAPALAPVAPAAAPAALPSADGPARDSPAARPAKAGSAAEQAPAPAPAAALPAYASALVDAGAPRELVARLDAFLETRHPGDQGRVYHGLQHSRDVAGVAARMASEARLEPHQAALVVLAAALHDLDPRRAPGMPPTVPGTLAYLAEDAEARALVEEFSRLFGFTRPQVEALIRATDFSPAPDRLRELQEEFSREAASAFPARSVGWARHWGLRLQVADKTAAYLGERRQSLAFVRGLAAEFRAGAEAAGRVGPTDAAIVAGTHGFMRGMAEGPEMELLPADLRERFQATYAYFQGLGDTGAAEAALRELDAASAPRGPPSALERDLASARRYIASIAGRESLDDRQIAGLYEQWLEDRELTPGSERALAVRRALLPAMTAADDASLEGVPSALLRHRASLLRLARDNGLQPSGVARVIEAAGLTRALARLGPEDFEHQAWLALRRASLERAVRRYPDNEQGRFLRQLVSHLAAPGGKSVEEVAREGAFAYVDFAGSTVLRTSSGRDPDARHPHAVFYVTRREERWRLDVYRQNRDGGRRDAELVAALKAWLVAGGIPAADLDD